MGTEKQRMCSDCEADPCAEGCRCPCHRAAPSAEPAPAPVLSDETHANFMQAMDDIEAGQPAAAPEGPSMRKNPGKYSMGYCCDGGPNGEKHSGTCKWNPESAAPEGREPLLKEVATWLQSKADELSRQAVSRMESEKDRNATVAELKQAKKFAEKMAGRELPLATVDQKSHKPYCDMQVRIGRRLESEAKQLSAWAELLHSYSEGQASERQQVAPEGREPSTGNPKGRGLTTFEEWDKLNPTNYSHTDRGSIAWNHGYSAGMASGDAQIEQERKWKVQWRNAYDGVQVLEEMLRKERPKLDALIRLREKQISVLTAELASAAEREKGLREALAKALEWSANFPLGRCDGIPSEADRIAANDVYVATRDALKLKT